MKKFLLVILLLATVGFGIWFYYFKNKETSDLPIQLPGNPFSTPSTPVQPHNPLGSDLKNDPEVLRDFKNQIINSNLIILDGTKISNEYALQLWHDENKGGEALLKYDAVAVDDATIQIVQI